MTTRTNPREAIRRVSTGSCPRTLAEMLSVMRARSWGPISERMDATRAQAMPSHRYLLSLPM